MFGGIRFDFFGGRGFGWSWSLFSLFGWDYVGIDGSFGGVGWLFVVVDRGGVFFDGFVIEFVDIGVGFVFVIGSWEVIGVVGGG